MPAAKGFVFLLLLPWDTSVDMVEILERKEDLVAIRNLWHRPVVHLSCDGNGQNLCDISSAVCEDLSFSSPLPESVPPSVMV